MTDAPSSPPTQAITVVVPTYKRPELLHRCIEALKAQNLEPNRFEIIVVDDAADFRVEEQVESWNCAKDGTVAKPRIRYVAVRGLHGPAAARNRGWQNATSPYVAFTDDDCAPEPGWLRAGLAALEEGADAAWGRLIMPLPENPTDYERDAARLSEGVFVTANLFCRWDALDSVDGFDVEFKKAWREDSDLYFRLLEQGARIVHVPDAQVIHYIRPAPWGISLQQLTKNVYEALLYKKHPELYREKIGNPRWDYYLMAILLPMACLALLIDAEEAAVAAFVLWVLLTGQFFFKRMAGNTWRVSHILEMAVTSALIPPLAIFWRWVGAARYKVLFF